MSTRPQTLTFRCGHTETWQPLPSELTPADDQALTVRPCPNCLLAAFLAGAADPRWAPAAQRRGAVEETP